MIRVLLASAARQRAVQPLREGHWNLWFGLAEEIVQRREDDWYARELRRLGAI